MLRSVLGAIGLSLVLISASSLGAVPIGMNYQGYLTDRDGAAMSDELLITFSIYTVELGGSPLWNDTLLVDVENGLFSVLLGRAANPFPVDLFETPLWLGITVESDNEMIPRRALTSVGFSFRAQDADSVQGKTAAELDQSEHTDDLVNPHEVTAAQVGAADESLLNAHAGDLNNPHATTAAQTGAAAAALFASHAGDPASHHVRYSDVDAVAAMGPTAATNPLHHERFTDSEAFDAVLASDGPGSQLDADTLDGINGDELYVQGELYNRDEIDALLVAAQGDQFTSVAVPVVGSFGCSLRSDSAISCWGSTLYPEVFNFPTVPLVQIATGRSHICGITEADGVVVCWGDDGVGQLNAPAGEFVQIDAGYTHTCGVRSDQTLACWGQNDQGQANPPPGSFLFVGAGRDHTCAIQTDNTVVCWGRNSTGQSSPPSGIFVELSGGEDHSCGRRADGSVTCWGGNAWGQSEDPSGDFILVDSGQLHNCGILSDNTVKCWGRNGEGQGSPPPGETFMHISAGISYSCGVRLNGTVICWGYDITNVWGPHP